MRSPRTIAELLQQLRDEQGLSERALATKLDVSPNAMNAWIRGMRIPDPPYVWRIAEMANVPLDQAMRMAGHLPPSAIETTQPARHLENRLAAVAAELSDRDLGLLLEFAKTMREWSDKHGQ